MIFNVLTKEHRILLKHHYRYQLLNFSNFYQLIFLHVHYFMLEFIMIYRILEFYYF